MKYCMCIYFLLVIFVKLVVPQGFQFVNPVRYPYSNYRNNPYIGTFVAIALPIDLTGPADLFISVNFESSYTLPSNQSTLVYPPVFGSRSQLYRLLESNINRYGYPGKGCLQRTICEVAEYSTENNGILGDMFNILLSPSSSKKEQGMEDYEESENYGRTKGQCKKYKKKCPFSILNGYSVIKNVYNLFDPLSIKQEMSNI